MSVTDLSIIIISLTIVQFLLSIWVKTRIESSIKHEYDKKLEDYKHQTLMRQRAALIAELFSEWLSFPEDESKLNKLAFESFLWLPEELARNLSQCISGAEKSPSIRKVLLKVREYLQDSTDNFNESEIIIFLENWKRKAKERGIVNEI